MRAAVSPIQRYCLSASEDAHLAPDMNIGVCVYFPVSKDSAYVLERVRRCVKRHVALNLRFARDTNGDFYQYIDDSEPEIELRSTSRMPTTAAPETDARLYAHYHDWYARHAVSEDHIRQVIDVSVRNKNRRYRITDEKPCAVTVIGSRDEGYTVCIGLHHAVCDAVSLAILADELAIAVSENISPAAADDRFMAHAQQDYERSQRLGPRQRAYWRDLLSDERRERQVSLLDHEPGHRVSAVIHVAPDPAQKDGRVSQIRYLSALCRALQAIGRAGEHNIISTTDNRRGGEAGTIVGCLFRHVIWRLPRTELDASGGLEKFFFAQGIRNLQNIDVPLDEILEEYHHARGGYPALEIGFSFRDASRFDLSGAAQVVPQYVDVIRDRLRLHLHVLVEPDRTLSMLIYDPNWLDPASLSTFGTAYASSLAN